MYKIGLLKINYYRIILVVLFLNTSNKERYLTLLQIKSRTQTLKDTSKIGITFSYSVKQQKS